jgi:hypothetical protein
LDAKIEKIASEEAQQVYARSLMVDLGGAFPIDTQGERRYIAFLGGGEIILR